MIRKQLELVHIACPCVRRYATYARITSGAGRPELYSRPPAYPSSRPPSRRRDDTEGGSSSTTFRRENIGRSASTTPGTFHRRPQLTEGDDQPLLPRYLRREAAQSSPTHPSTLSQERPGWGRNGAFVSTAIPPQERVFRSQHFDPTQAKDPKSEMKILEPHVLSARLRKLCNANQIDTAVALLKSSPLDAQNTPVWNTLIWECMKAKRFKLGYQLFIDMKRRGFSPTTRTFQTMFTGLSRIEHWSSHPKQLENARSIYDSFQRHMNAVKKEDPNSPELSVNPLASYITLLGDAGQYQEIFDVYYAMDSEGLLSPNQFIFTAMFQALSVKHDASSSPNSTINMKNAADAKLLWTQMLKASRKAPGFQVDSFIVTSALTTLSRGRPTDQDFAFEIVRDYFGLTAPGETPSMGTLPLAPQSFAAVLKLCNTSRKHALCDHFLQQVKKRSEALGGVSLLDRLHVEEVLKARLSLPASGSATYTLDLLEWMLRQEITGRNGPKIRPAISTFNLVMTACWRDADWKSAARTFDLMTGYHSHDFMDGAILDPPRFDKRAAGRNLVPSAETMSSLVRTAYTTRDHANVRQCLRIVDHLGVYQYFGRKSETDPSNKAAKSKAFYVSKLASALVDSATFVLDSRGKIHSSPEEARRWKVLAGQARETLRRVPKSEFIPTVEEK